MVNANLDVPDAPWIRQAELFGVDDDGTDIYCPVCNSENPESYYIDKDNVIVGCTDCLKKVDAWSWYCDRIRNE